MSFSHFWPSSFLPIFSQEMEPESQFWMPKETTAYKVATIIIIIIIIIIISYYYLLFIIIITCLCPSTLLLGIILKIP